MSAINQRGRKAFVTLGNASRTSRRLGLSVAALMLAGTALGPSQAQVANLGGLIVSRNDFVNFNPPGTGIEPSEITNGTLRINPLAALTFGGDLTDSGGVFSLLKFGANDLTLTGVNTHSGQTTVQGGRLIAGSATAFSPNSALAAAGQVATLATADLNGFSQTVRGLVGNPTGVVTTSNGPATLTIDSNINTTFNGALQGELAIVKRGTSVQTVSNLNPGLAQTNATGPITLEAGTLRIGTSNALGSGVMTVTGNGTLGTTGLAPLNFDNNVVLQANLTLSTPVAQSLTMNGVISGAGSLTKLGIGTVTLAGANDYTGGTTLSGGRLVLGNAGAFGTGLVTQTQTSIVGLLNPAVGLTVANNFQLNGTSLQIETPNLGQVFSFSGNIAGGPDVNLIAGNGGTVVLSGNNSFNGLIRLRSGTLGITNASGVNSSSGIRAEGGDRTISILAADQVVSTRLSSHIGDGALEIIIDAGANNVEFSGALRDANGGAGDTLALVKTGSAILTVSNASASLLGRNEASGGFTVNEGTLNLTGRMANDIFVLSGAALTGTGFQDLGTTSIDSDATLSPGDARTAAPAIGTLTLGNLTLGGTASTIFDLGVPSINTASPINDLVIVNGNLDLGGSTFNFNILPGFTTGTYRLMTYGGAVAGTANLGLLPLGFNYALNIGGGNVDLAVTLADFYWDGSGPFGNTVVDGGNGTWNGANTNWTDVGGNISIAWQNNARAFFTANPGDVTVDGNFTYSTLFFTVDGYVLNPAAGATLGADAGTIDVAAASTATINVDLVGTNGLAKEGAGTLVLGGNNSFTGGLSINRGILAVTQAAALGADAVTVNGGAQTLRFTADMTVTNTINGVGVGYNIDTGANTVTLEGSLSGGGADKFGSGTLVLNNATNAQPNALAVFAGTLIVNGGVQGGVGGAGASVIGGTGTITGLVSTNGTLSPGVAPGQAGTLTAGSLTLGTGSTSLFDLGVVGVVGGTNDLMVVNGNFNLDGTLNVNPLAGWHIGTGSFRLFNYGGTLTDSGLALGGALLTPPADVTYTVNTSIAGQVNLDIGYTGAFNWDGNGAPVDGVVQGGAGTWDGSGTNWTNSDGRFNLPYVDNFATVANFGGAAGGAVDVVGTRTVGTINFSQPGYVLGGSGNILLDGGAINVTAADATIGVAINGNNGFTKGGTGNLILTGTSGVGGNATVAAGTLTVNGSLANAGLNLAVASGATLDGTGTVAGSVAVADDGRIAINGSNVGVLTLGNLALSGGSLLDFQLGAANTLGGPLNDQIVVTGNLTLDGLLNVTQSAGGNFTVGIYNLFTYGGALTDNGLQINGLLPGALTGTVQHNSAARQINLVVGAAGVPVLNWDGTDFTAQPPGAPLAQGGNGIFNLTNTNWTGAAPGEINAAWVNNAIGIFGVTGGAVDVADTIGFTGFGFQADGYTLSGAGSLVTNAATGSFVSVDAGLTATVNTIISGTGALFKQGAGTLVLGGDNSNSGGVSLTAGTIALTSNTGLGTGTLTFSGGTTLRADANLSVNNAMALNGQSSIGTQANQLGLQGVLSGSGTLVKTGSGLLILNGANSYSGGTNLTAGAIQLGNSSGLGTGALAMAGGTALSAGAAGLVVGNAISLAGLGTINTNASTFTLNGVVSGIGRLIKTGTGNLVLNAANTYDGGNALTNGTITVGNSTALGAGSLTMSNGTTLASGVSGLTLANVINTAAVSTVNVGTGTLGLSGQIVGSGSIVKTGSGNLILSGDNSYFGSTLLNNGTITVGSNTALSTGLLTMDNNTTLNAGANGLALANNILLNAPFAGVANVNVGNGLTFTLNGVISSTLDQALIKQGGGNLVLNGANSFGFATVISAGTITVGNSSALGTSELRMADGTTLAAGANNLVLANNIVTLGINTVDTGANTLTLGGVLFDSGTLTKVGTGKLVLTGNSGSNYTGNVNLTQGTLTIGNSNALGTGNLAMAAGTTLQAGGAGVVLANTIGMAGGATVDVAGQTLTLGGVISGTGPLSVIDSTANAASDLTLTGVNTYTGGTIVTGTQVRVGQDANLGNAAGGITLNGGTLWTTASFSSARAVTLGTGGGTARVAPGTALTLTGVVSGTSLTKIGGGELILNAANSFAGGTTLTMGRITVGNNAALGTGALAMAGGTTLGAGANNLVLANAVSTAGVGTVDTGTNTLTLAGVVSGAGSIAKVGTGNLVLNGANTYAGGTALNAGTITVGNNAALGTGALTMADATTLAAGVTGLTVANNITTLGAGTINSGASPSVFTLSGVISGAGSVTKQGTGLLTLSGASTYTGATTVAAGALNVTGSLVSAVTVNAGAALNGTGTVGALNVLAGGSVNPGAPGTTNVATLSVNGPATLNGTYSVNISGSTADRISASGPLALGGTLTVASVTPPLFGQEFVVASGSTRTGTFVTTTGLELFGPAFRAVVDYTATTALIRINPNSLVEIGNRFGGLTGNALEVAQAFDRAVALGYNPQAFFALYNAGSNTPRALREVSGEQRATERRVVLDTNRVFRETALDRLNLGLASMAGQQVSTSDGDSALTFFLRGAGSWGKSQTSGAATGFQTEQLGLLTGLDWARDGITVGGMFHYTTTDVEFSVLGGSSRVETVGGTVYGGYRKDAGLVANAGLSVSGARTNGSRVITLPGFTQALAGRTTGTTYQLFAELAFDFMKDANTQIEPFVRNSYIGADIKALTETGGIAALSAARQSYNINVFNAGLRGATIVKDGKVNLNASVAWQRTSGAREAATAIGIPAVGQNGLIRSVGIDADALLLQAGAGVNLSDKIRFSLDYSGLIGERNDDHGGRATLNFKF
jgi:fibronectin-binding autotransporter adhesin